MSKKPDDLSWRELKTRHSTIQPQVDFSDEDWCKIEVAGGRSLSAKQRDDIKLFSRIFVSEFNGALSLIKAKDIQEQIKSIIDHAEALKSALQYDDKRLASAHGWVTWALHNALMGEESGARHACADVIRAAKAALPELMSMTVETRRGPKNRSTKDQFFRYLMVEPFELSEWWPRAYAMAVGRNQTAALWGAGTPTKTSSTSIPSILLGELSQAFMLMRLRPGVSGCGEQSIRHRQESSQKDGTQLIDRVWEARSQPRGRRPRGRSRHSGGLSAPLQRTAQGLQDPERLAFGVPPL